MAQVTWKTGTSGLWQTAADWTGGVVPGVGDDALLTPTGIFTATSTSFVEVHSVQLGAHATLDINGGGFRMDAGTGTGANAGTIQVDNANQLTIGGNVVNSGTILLDSTGSTTQITISSPSVTLSGGGAVVMSASGANYIDGNNGGFQLVNVDNTISGGGNLGNNDLTIVNQAAGTIDANTLVILDVQTQNLLTNAGLMEATAGGTLVIVSTNVKNTGGMVLADGGTVDLSNTTMFGGTVKSLHGGVLQTFSGNGALDGLSFGAVTMSGTLTITNATNLYLAGTINDAASTFALSSTANTTQMFVNSNLVTLQGGGSVVMSNSNNNYIQSNGNFQYQFVNVDNTISGTGNLGNGNLTFVNEKKGVVNANNAAISGSTGVLALNANGGVTNAGLIEDTGTAGLAINSTNVYQSSTGIIAAKGAGAHVDLNSSNIVGGKLLTTGTGVIQTTSGISQLDGLDSGAITNAGKLLINNATDLNVMGVLNNTGSISETSTGNTTEFRLNSWMVTLQGGGTLTLSDNANNYILAVTSSFQTFDNVDNTISGAGDIGNGGMQFVNGGTVNATGTTAQLQVNLGFAGSGINNAGALWEATGAAGLLITNGLFTNNGTVQALNNSSVTYSSSAADLNLVAGMLTGGIWKAIATGSGTSTVSLSGGPITTDAASITISGAGSVFQAGNGSTYSTLESTLTTIAAGGSLSILGGRAYATTLALADNGTLALGGATASLSAASITVGTGGVLSGNGAVTTSIADGGTVTASGGLLHETKNLTGAGSVTIATGSMLEVDGTLSAKTVTFGTGTGEVLALAKPASTTSTIAGFGSGDTIDLLNIGVTKLTFAGGVLTIMSGATKVAALRFSGSYTTASFSFTSDGHNGTNIVGTGLALAHDLTSVGGLNQLAWSAHEPASISAGGDALGAAHSHLPSSSDLGMLLAHTG